MILGNSGPSCPAYGESAPKGSTAGIGFEESEGSELGKTKTLGLRRRPGLVPATHGNLVLPGQVLAYEKHENALSEWNNQILSRIGRERNPFLRMILNCSRSQARPESVRPFSFADRTVATS